jgi:hypothetical protein
VAKKEYKIFEESLESMNDAFRVMECQREAYNVARKFEREMKEVMYTSNSSYEAKVLYAHYKGQCEQVAKQAIVGSKHLISEANQMVKSQGEHANLHMKKLAEDLAAQTGIKETKEYKTL